MKFLVTGAAGFIGSNLVDCMLRYGHSVVGVDNFSTGKKEFLNEALQNPKFEFYEIDLLKDSLAPATDKYDAVFHLAANADVKNGLCNPKKDVEQNILVTHNVLEWMRKAGLKKIAFASTGSVYGETKIIPTPEDAHLEPQTSLYSASKLAGEALIQAYCEGYDFTSYIFRFVSIMGKRYHHGHLLDFYNQLRANRNELVVLGDGTQTKSYLHVYDCIRGMMAAMQEETGEKVNIYNLGTDETITVADSIQIITAWLGCTPTITYTGGKRGWIGDNPLIYLDTKKIRSLGWTPHRTIKESIIYTLIYLYRNETRG